MNDNRVIHLDDANFDSATQSGLALIDFWAPWCGPCRMQGPILDDVVAEIGEGATVAKVNVDEAPRLAGRFGVRSIPTLVLLNQGEIVDQWVGVQPAGILSQALRRAGA